MTYNELKKIARPHIRENDVLPSNSFLLLVQLHIPFKNEKQCEEDYGGKMNPLYNSPAFLLIKSKTKTLYFNSASKYWNFYIFHEISHYILGHESDSAQNELDADMLACCLAAPIENLPTTIKTARDLSTLCQIPIDKAEVYWNEIKEHLSKRNPLSKHKVIIVGMACVAILLLSAAGFISARVPSDQEIAPTVNSAVSNATIHTSSPNQQTAQIQTQTVVVTISGTKYHLSDCRYVKKKTNLTTTNIDDAIQQGYAPCKVCIK